MKLHDRVQKILRENLCLRSGETLLIVCDDPSWDVGSLFHDVAHELGFDVLLLLMPELTENGEEPPRVVAAAMREADVALCATAKSMTHTNARIEAARAGTRVVTMPGVTLDMLRDGAACADYSLVEHRTAVVTDLLTKAKTARIEKEGHTLLFDLEGRSGVASPGVYRNPGESGNFPSGEAYIAPCETRVQGSMLIDGSMVGIGALERPLIVTIDNGHLTSIEGSDSERLGILFERPENGTIAELGIGTNEAAILSGIILEDEKLYGTVHIAFGTNTSFGGTNKADCHYDGIILNPTLWLDDTCIIREGEFLID